VQRKNELCHKCVSAASTKRRDPQSLHQDRSDSPTPKALLTGARSFGVLWEMTPQEPLGGTRTVTPSGGSGLSLA